MASASGGTETTKRSQAAGGDGNKIGEILSQGGVPVGVGSIPATPTGKGWVFSPGAGTFAAGNWSASCATADPPTGGLYNISPTIRFFKHSSGTYTSIGSINVTAFSMPATRTVVSYAATAMGTVTFAAGDLLYVDLWYDTTPNSIGGTTWDIYESTSSTAGVVSDMQVTTSTFTAGGITNNSMASTDSLVVSDLGPALQRWPGEALSVVESILYADTALPVDGLTASDSLLGIDTVLAIDALTVSDLGGSLQRWPVDGLTASDSVLAQDTVLSTEALITGDIFLATDTYLPVEQIPVADAFSTGAGITNNTMASTDGLIVTDSFLASDTYQPGEVLSVADSLVGTGIYMPVDTLVVTDLGAMQRWGIESLLASDSFMALSTYGALDGLSASDRLLVTDGALWTEALQAVDLSSMVSAIAAALLYLSATCTTRDMQATAKTRDMQARVTTRDEQAIAKTRG